MTRIGVQTCGGLEATVGLGSYLFNQLVAGPAAEADPTFPDPSTLTTLVLSGVDESEVPGHAEVALFHLRRAFPALRFSFWPVSDLLHAPVLVEVDESPDVPATRCGLRDVHKFEPIVFYNRGVESDPIPGYLYFYRLLESCFDEVFLMTRRVSAARSPSTNSR